MIPQQKNYSSRKSCEDSWGIWLNDADSGQQNSLKVAVLLGKIDNI
jgi:hypothetical protein